MKTNTSTTTTDKGRGEVVSSRLVGPHSRFRINEFRTRFGETEWFVLDAERTDEATGLPVVIFQGPSLDAALDSLSTCVLCGEVIDHGCNTAVCSQSCADEAEMIHERSHAGVSDPDACDRGDSCPSPVK